MHVVVLSGAGLSAASGLKTFRDNGGLWESHRIEDVATPEAWEADRALVLRFYNDRRRALLAAEPNAGHRTIANWEREFDVSVVTQNVDDLHERAGSTRVLHLHGELRKARSTRDPARVVPVEGWELREGDLCELGSQLRPHIVWFGESVDLMPEAERLVESADAVVVVGTSLQVYPAAGLLWSAPQESLKILVDPRPAEVFRTVEVVAATAEEGLPLVTERLRAFAAGRR